MGLFLLNSLGRMGSGDDGSLGDTQPPTREDFSALLFQKITEQGSGTLGLVPLNASLATATRMSCWPIGQL
jgi:hypothetical protein